MNQLTYKKGFDLIMYRYKIQGTKEGFKMVYITIVISVYKVQIVIPKKCLA